MKSEYKKEARISSEPLIIFASLIYKSKCLHYLAGVSAAGAAGVSAAAGAGAGAAVVGAAAGAVVAAGAGAIPERVTGVLIAKEAQMLITQIKIARLQVAFSIKSVVLR